MARSRMIGMGTPKIHNRIPRPMTISPYIANQTACEMRYGQEGSGGTIRAELLPRAVESVARVAEARKNVAVFVQSLIDRGGPHVNLGMVFVELLDAFGRCEQTNKAQFFGAVLFEPIDCGDGGVARRQHGVDRDHQTLG
jgi:hypothetical protein